MTVGIREILRDMFLLAYQLCRELVSEQSIRDLLLLALSLWIVQALCWHQFWKELSSECDLWGIVLLLVLTLEELGLRRMIFGRLALGCHQLLELASGR